MRVFEHVEVFPPFERIISQIRKLGAVAVLGTVLAGSVYIAVEHGPLGGGDPPIPPDGTTINLTDTSWTCTGLLSGYGPLPIRVNQHWTVINQDGAEFGIRLAASCQGDNNPATVDLITTTDADGVHGPYGDAFRINNATPGARNLVVSGEADCGKGRASNHQDAMQAIGGTNVIFRDFTAGYGADATTGMATCNAAGGAAFYSSSGSTHPIDMGIEDSNFKGCNRGLTAGAGSGQSGYVTNSTFKSGHDPSIPTEIPDGPDPDTEPDMYPYANCTDSNRERYEESPPCLLDETEPITITVTNIICDSWPWS